GGAWVFSKLLPCCALLPLVCPPDCLIPIMRLVAHALDQTYQKFLLELPGGLEEVAGRESDLVLRTAEQVVHQNRGVNGNGATPVGDEAMAELRDWVIRLVSPALYFCHREDLNQVSRLFLGHPSVCPRREQPQSISCLGLAQQARIGEPGGNRPLVFGISLEIRPIDPNIHSPSLPFTHAAPWTEWFSLPTSRRTTSANRSATETPSQ